LLLHSHQALLLLGGHCCQLLLRLCLQGLDGDPVSSPLRLQPAAMQNK
jgi:hypothetical protein